MGVWARGLPAVPSPVGSQNTLALHESQTYGLQKPKAKEGAGMRLIFLPRINGKHFRELGTPSTLGFFP